MLNNSTAVGRLTKDVDLRYTGNGKAVGSFTLAVNRDYKADGQPEADFLQCVIWGKSAEALTNYTRKGSLIDISGRLQTRSYDNQQGQRVYVTEINVQEFHFLDSKKDSQQENNQPSKSDYSNFKNEDPFDKSSKPIDIQEDDLPF